MIATIYFFYNEVLQERPWLIDGINLYDYVALLSGILAFTFFLRLLRTSTPLSKREKEEIHLVACMIPFFNEIFLTFKIIQRKYNLFILRQNIAKSYTSLDASTEQDEGVEEKIQETISQVNQTEVKMEKREKSRMRLKVCSVLGDILQACVISILLLRSDLRVRGALISLRKTNFVGGSNEDGNTQGNVKI